jgi:hypothetical protein
MESEIPLSLQNLTHFGLRAGVDMRPTLLRVLTDLYVQKLTHTPDEERHYTELALRLLDAVDVATRMVVAGRLSRHLAPPPQVIRRLAGDLPDVAALVRAHPLLQSSEAKAGKPTAPAAPAGANNKPVAASPEPEAQDKETDSSVQPPGVIGADVASELNELFFAASASERRLILLNLEIVAPLPAGGVDLMRDASVGQRLESAALTRNREEFARHLGQSLRIPHSQAQRIASDEFGEPVVTAAKALAMPRDAVYRILLFVNTAVGHSVERVHALATLYDELTIQAAEHMVAIWQALHNAARVPVRHQPLFWNDETRVRARTATTIVRRAPSTQRSTGRRDAS